MNIFSSTPFCKSYPLRKTETAILLLKNPMHCQKKEKYLYPQHIFSGDVKCRNHRLDTTPLYWGVTTDRDVPVPRALPEKIKLSSIKGTTETKKQKEHIFLHNWTIVSTLDKCLWTYFCTYFCKINGQKGTFTLITVWVILCY